MLRKVGYYTYMQVILGIDEVGRGCWAGPLVAGAVILRAPISGLRDSKKLSAGQRERLAAAIYADGAHVGLGWVTAAELDDVGMTAAVRLAIMRAVQAIDAPFDHIVIDGAFNYLASTAQPQSYSVETMVRADDTVPSVSAASIVAKVARDEYMRTAALQFPGYGFERHVGYGTKVHQHALQAQGPCVLHRQSFKPVRHVMEQANDNKL